ncbi:MAG: cytochrome c3 family protein [Ginsengibacter sp.]
MFRSLNKIQKSHFIVVALSITVCIGNLMFTTTQLSTAKKELQIGIGEFAGSESCKTCHKDIYESHLATAHYLDSRPASKQFIKGDFSRGKNKFIYNQWMEVIMEEKKDSFFQTSFINGVEYQKEAFGVVVGSGRKGQTYLYWNDNSLFQLPVSYFTGLSSWCNSPGFPLTVAKFNRIIPAECLECHATYAKVQEDENQLPFFDKKQIIYGIDCERCHGPAARHVGFQQSHPEEKSARFILSIHQLSRQQRVDGCALCHSGFRDAIKPRFSFLIGDTLANFSAAKYSPDSISTLDVHGNQYGLLMASKCFKNSAQLDCSSCHDVHVNEVNSPKLFSQRCITCHSEIKHTALMLPENKKQLLANNCIDCHMPMLPSSKIVLNVADTKTEVPDVVRTHKVAIYPDQTKELLKKIKSMK